MSIPSLETTSTTRRARATLAIGTLVTGALVTVALLASAIASAVPQRGGAPELITPDQLRSYLYFVASDEMEGRATPSRGLRITALFLATQLSRWGLTPAGDDGSFFQRIEMRRTKVDPQATQATLGDRTFRFGDDFLASYAAGTASGPLVYVDHGWYSESRGVDPYAGLDVRGKILVVRSGLPPGLDFRALRSPEEQRAWVQPAAYAREHGAVGIIALPAFNDLARWDASVERAVERGSTEIVAFAQPGDDALPSIVASPQMVAALFGRAAGRIGQAAMAGEPFEPFELDPAQTVSFTVATREESESTQNVVAILEGSHPERRDEYVAIGAHYDHVGIGNPVDGDAIYNGADDDGSGTVSVLAIAEAFAKGPRPERSILFVWHAGEESGLLGSRYATEFPPVPLDRVVTQLNIDMIGRSRQPGDTTEANQELTGPDETYIIGPNIQSDELGEVVDSVNADLNDLTINHLYDEVNHPSRFFFRSDHYNYARHGIPIAFFFTGVHEDYHRPSDHPDKIDYDKMAKIAQTIYGVAWRLASMDGRPALNPDLPSQLRQQ